MLHLLLKLPQMLRLFFNLPVQITKMIFTHGVYKVDISQSSSGSITNTGGFEITYQTEGSKVSGDYIQDRLSIGNAIIQNLTMGLATQVEYVATGIMGIGFDADESVATSGGRPYMNVIDEMQEQGLIASRSYSLFLDDMSKRMHPKDLIHHLFCR